MALSNIGKRYIAPTHPGEVLRKDFMPDYNLSTGTLAKMLGVSRQTINEILLERRSISPAMALRLSRLFGNSPRFWLNAQNARDIWEAERNCIESLEQIPELKIRDLGK